VHDDGRGILHLLLAFDRELLEEVAGAADAEALAARGGIDPAALPEDATYEPIETDEEVGARVTLPFEAAEEVAPAIDAAYASLGSEIGALAGVVGPFESFRIEGDQDGWRFEAQTVPGEAPDELTAVLLSEASFTFRLRMPGELVAHNADRLEDGVLGWDLPLTGEGSRSLRAASRFDDGGWPPLAGVIAAAAAIVVGIGTALYLMRPRAERPDAAAR
jgi:hypothetical protein